MRLDYQRIKELFEPVKNLDSKTFVEIPQGEIVEPWEYRAWLAREFERKWMIEFNNRNRHYYPNFDFNTESGIQGYFGDIYVSHCKLYRYDGTEQPIFKDDYRAKRGFLVRDHYSELDVVKVQIITNNMVEFLTQEGIQHNRVNFERR